MRAYIAILFVLGCGGGDGGEGEAEAEAEATPIAACENGALPECVAWIAHRWGCEDGFVYTDEDVCEHVGPPDEDKEVRQASADLCAEWLPTMPCETPAEAEAEAELEPPALECEGVPPECVAWGQFHDDCYGNEPTDKEFCKWETIAGFDQSAAGECAENLRTLTCEDIMF